MTRLQRKPLNRPDEVRPYPRGRTEIFQLDDFVVGRMIMEPGWVWKRDVGPLAGTDSCQYHHLGVVVSGVLHVDLPDGTSLELGPDEAYEVPPGHQAHVVGDEPWVALDFAGARSYARPAVGSGERILASIVISDIVDSTVHLERMGDAAWRELLSEHNQRMRAEFDRFRGREVGSTGDGLIALFDGTARAVQSARGMSKASRDLGLSIRLGIHTGEVELATGGPRGLAVHLAARIMAMAGPDEVLVSGTTAELLAGSGIGFKSRGRHQLKGIEGEREVFALVD